MRIKVSATVRKRYFESFILSLLLEIVMSLNKDSASSGEQASSSESLLSTDVKGLPCLNPRNDPTNLAVCWKRSLNLYLTAKGVMND